MSKLLHLIECHRFFVRESLLYVGKPNKLIRDMYVPDLSRTNERKSLSNNYNLDFKHTVYYPIAYIKFMFFSFRDLINT